ncbi:MAG TPA: hypothetical protein VFP13_08025, partial [Actinomycetota bacterium]|nr:hypothetical protein [Actinomycetota bacterium]
LFQTIAASLAYLAPLFLRSDALSRAELIRRIDRHATVRTIVWNIGVASTATAAAFGSWVGTAGSVAMRLGWGLIVAATLWLGAVILLPPPPLAVAEGDGQEVGG